jgi:hypothetical protein
LTVIFAISQFVLCAGFAFGTVEDAISISGILGLFSAIMLLTSLATLMIAETKGQSLAGIEQGMMYADSSSTTDLNPDVDDSVKRKENLSQTVLFNYSFHSLLCEVASPSAYIYSSLNNRTPPSQRNT